MKLNELTTRIALITALLSPLAVQAGAPDYTRWGGPGEGQNASCDRMVLNAEVQPNRDCASGYSDGACAPTSAIGWSGRPAAS